MFLDASALVAMILDEPEARALADRLDASSRPDRVTSALAVFEAALAVNRVQAGGHKPAEAVVRRLLDRSAIIIAAIDDEAGALALAAHARYGKGTGHPARLNMGDCFAYAMAKRYGVPLLYKGDDFALTDLA